MSSISPVSNCNHSVHLFDNPLCENQSLLVKIANVVFHVLTFGIPLAIYHVFSCCFCRTSVPQHSEDLQEISVNSILQNQLVQETLEFARRTLEESSAIATQFSAGWSGPSETNQPINQDIARLTTLYLNANKNFTNVLKQNKEDPWSTPEVINAADELMKISFSIGVLTLEDLQPFTENLASKGENRSYAKALTEQDSYQYRTFYYCTTVYHMLRGAIAWGASPRDPQKESLIYPRPIPTTHSNLFYQNGTIQNSWNVLYNQYCDLIRQYVTEEELRSSDSRHANWTQKDIDASSFQARPDSRPT